MCSKVLWFQEKAPNETYLHRSLLYKTSLSDPVLKEELDNIFEAVIDKATLYSDLRASQACEHASRAVSLRAPKHLHYGESQSLDFRVKATAACLNEGRKYLPEVETLDVILKSSMTVMQICFCYFLQFLFFCFEFIF